MKKHYYAIGAIVGLGILGAILIIVTIPANKTSSSGDALPTVAADRTDRLSGGSIEGQLAFSRQGYLWIWKGDSATRLPIEPGKSVVANNSVQLVQPSLSPDGSRLAYIRQDETFADLWVASSNGSSPRALSSDRGSGTPRSPQFIGRSLWAFNPAWSPDGTQIAFLTDRGTDNLTLWSTGPANFNPRQISSLAVGSGGIQRPSWSPQGEALVLAAYQDGKFQIYTVKASGGGSNRLTDAADGAYDPAWSPDGKWIAFVQRRGNSSELWLMQADGSGATQLSAQASRSPVWSPDGTRLAYMGLKDGTFELYTIEIGPSGKTSANPQQLSNGAKLDGADGLSWGR